MYQVMRMAGLLLYTAVGCAPLHYPSVKAVDSTTGEVLHDAYVERETTMWQPGMPGLPVRCPFKTEKFETAGNDAIEIPRVLPEHRLDVKCDGYKPHVIEHPWRQRLNPIARVFGDDGAYYDSGCLVVPLKSDPSARDVSPDLRD